MPQRPDSGLTRSIVPAEEQKRRRFGTADVVAGPPGSQYPPPAPKALLRSRGWLE
jgi:hypothetical protein